MPNLGQLSKLMSRKLSQSLTLGAAILALSAGTAQAQIAGAPANPTTNCSWNWNYWISPDGSDDNPGGGNQRLNPALRVFNVDGSWYSTSITPDRTDSLGDNVAPAQLTGRNSAWERAYGIGYFVMEPGSLQTINITDSGVFDGHVFGMFDSAGNQFDRAPQLTAGEYFGSSNNDSHVSAPGIRVGAAFSTSFTFTVPADGIVYLHYIWADEDSNGNFATNDGCQNPGAEVTKTSGVTGPISPDGTFEQTFSLRYENTGDISLQLPTALDNVESIFGAAFNPSTAAADSSDGVTAAPTVTSSGNVTSGAFEGTLPVGNAGFDGDSSTNLFDGVSGTLRVGDFVDVSFTVRLDSEELTGGTVNTIIADATAPGDIDIPVTGTDENGGSSTSTPGSTSSQFTPPVAAPSLSMTKVADSTGPHTVGDVVTYTYTVTNNGDTNIQGVTIGDTHNGSDPAPFPGNETLLTDAAPTGDSTDAAPNGSWDVLAPGDTLTFTGTYTVTQTDAENL